MDRIYEGLMFAFLGVSVILILGRFYYLYKGSQAESEGQERKAHRMRSKMRLLHTLWYISVALFIIFYLLRNYLV